jgi:hypothetical protein
MVVSMSGPGSSAPYSKFPTFSVPLGFFHNYLQGDHPLSQSVLNQCQRMKDSQSLEGPHEQPWTSVDHPMDGIDDR